MFGGMGKDFWGLRVDLFIDLKVASKNVQKNVPDLSISHCLGKVALILIGPFRRILTCIQGLT